MKIYALLLVGAIIMVSSCGNKTTMPPNSPFAHVSMLPFQAPDFNHIKNSDFKPALEEGIKEQMAELEKIANNDDTPTFENTVMALEKSGPLFHRVSGVFNLLSEVNTDSVLEETAAEVEPPLSITSLGDALYFNFSAKLFKRIETIYNQRGKLKLDPESNRLVEYYYQRFVSSGVGLSDNEKERFKKLDGEGGRLWRKFPNQLLAAINTGGLLVSDKAELAGLSTEELDAAAAAAKAANKPGKWLIVLKNTTQQPELKSLTIRATRQKLFEASWNRAERNDSNDTRATISRLAIIRAQLAKLLGFPNFAARVLMWQMAKTPEAVEQFLFRLIPAATAKAKLEAADIQKLIDDQKGGFQLQPWDWDFYAEQLRKANYNLDENEVKPYFELNTVLQKGVFYAANQLYGITFKERKDLPVYNKDVRVFEVFDKDGSSLALIYFDYFKRENKGDGAWMYNLADPSKLLGTKPVLFNIFDFTKPADGQPILISFDDVITMFHQFGHDLQDMFSDQQYPTLSGINTAGDFIDFPALFNEHWASDPQVFKNYARHFKTGEPMPQELVDKIKKAATFNQGYRITEILAAAYLDMQWHTLPADSPMQNVDKFEAEALHKANLDLTQVPPRYRSSYFSHIWSDGSPAGYYAFLWAEMLGDDAFAWFKEHGGLTRENGQRFRDMILSRGNTQDVATIYRDCFGRDPDIQPMLEYRGLVETKE